MTDPKEDELAGTEQPFVSHLIELRDRLIRACIAIGVCFGVLSIWPGPVRVEVGAGTGRPARKEGPCGSWR